MIPKILHRIWVGNPIPDHLAAFEDNWRQLHPDWQFKLWTDKDLGWLQNQQLYDRAELVVPPDAVGQFRSDLARYEILQRYGGVYADCDVEPVKNFDNLLNVDAFAGWEETNMFVGNTVLGSVAGHPLWRQMIDAIPDACSENKGKAATWLSGPRVLSRVVSARGRVEDFTVYPQSYFFPYSYKDVKRATTDPSLLSYPNAYAIHHWEHTRTLRNRVMRRRPVSEPRLSYTIMAHKKRERWVPDLQAQLENCSVTWDKFNDRHETGLRAIRSYDANATHHVVVQDDALLCGDFVETAHNALRYVPESCPVSFYTGRVKPHSHEFSQIHEAAKREGASFISGKGPWWGVAIAFPVDSIDDLAEFYSKADNIPNYDRRSARFYESRGIPCYYSLPSIVDHRVEDNPSLVAGRQNLGRYAREFVGPRSGLDIDWSGPVFRSGM
jgi:hypothetical protein